VHPLNRPGQQSTSRMMSLVQDAIVYSHIN
jgi:hypothetical protein